MRALLALLLAAGQTIPSTWHWVKASSMDIELALPAALKQVGTHDAWNDPSVPPGRLRRVVSVAVQNREEPWTLAQVHSNPDCDDCLEVSDLTTSTPTLDGMAFQLEVARVSGSFFHFHNSARVRAYHQLSPGKWLDIEAITPTWAGREELLAIVRSVRRSQPR